jgi:hypothetical protein
MINQRGCPLRLAGPWLSLLLDIMQVWLLSPVAALTMVTALAVGAEVKPTDPRTPLFRIFAPIPMKSAGIAGPTGFTFDARHPLVVISSVSDVRLDRDRKGVTIVLTPEDARKFAALTRKYNQGLLLLEAEGRVLEAMQVTAPVTDGVIVFKHPDDASAAEYVRRRFRIGEFR